MGGDPISTSGIKIGPSVPVTAADDGEVNRKREAKRYYELGAKEYNLGKYRNALTAFQAAYRFYAEPVFLFNLGQCYRLLGMLEEEVQAYKAYLRERPDAPNKRLIDPFIKRAEDALASKRKDPSATLAPREPNPLAPLMTASPHSFRSPSMVLWGTGGASLALGLGLGGAAIGLFSVDGHGTCGAPPGVHCPEKYKTYDSGVAAAVFGAAGVMTGIGLIIGAIVRRSRGDRLSLFPIFGPSSFALGGIF